MMKKNVFLFYVLLLLSNVSAFAQMVELPFSQRVQNSTDIFEGKVVSKTSFWNAQHSLIFTANQIEVYKVFKGNISSPIVDIITQGGQVDYEIQAGSNSLDLTEGDIGVFLAESSSTVSPQTKNAAFKTYGDMQGFIKYNLAEKSASDPFKKYINIREDVYKPIVSETGQAIKEIKTFTIAQEEASPKKTKSVVCSNIAEKKINKSKPNKIVSVEQKF